MRHKRVLGFLILSMILILPNNALAGATIKINETAKIELGFLLQTLFLHTEEDIDDDASFESVDDFKVRRARLRVGADIAPWVNMFFQTEAADTPGTGSDMRIIDAFIQLKPHPLANLYVGENMVPAARQNVTGSGALMAVDRPGIIYKNLTWGTRALSTFATKTFGQSDAGLTGDVDVRDTGATLFGTTSFNEMLHLKYYLGAYDGVQRSEEDNLRYAGRVQVNLFDPEESYYNSATYLGSKRTVALGFAIDTQSDVAVDLTTGNPADYLFYTLDLFTEYPLGPGSLSFETAYIALDLDDAEVFNFTEGQAEADNHFPEQSAGDGFYAQAGYYLHNWQPWIAYEQWNSDSPDDLGSYDALRFGISYFIEGHHANIKAGYEIFSADENFVGTNEDTIGTFVAGLYVTY